MSATVLYDYHGSFGDDPVVGLVDPEAAPVTFSAWDYAGERCVIIESLGGLIRV